MKIYKPRKKSLSEVFKKTFEITGYFKLSERKQKLCIGILILIFFAICLWNIFTLQFGF